MKKSLLFLAIIVSLISCGGDKKKEETTENATKEVNKYSLVIDAIYEKNDSIVVFYQKDNYFQYEKPISLKVSGSTQIQRLIIDMPANEKVENFTIFNSTNKEQNYLMIKNLSVMNNNAIVFDGDNFKFVDYFAPDASFSWDMKNSRYNLVHTGKYPPGMVGTNKLIETLAK